MLFEGKTPTWTKVSKPAKWGLSKVDKIIRKKKRSQTEQNDCVEKSTEKEEEEEKEGQTRAKQIARNCEKNK